MERVVDLPVPQAVEEINDVAHFILQESITKGIGVVRLTTHERVQRRTAKHFVDVPVPQIWAEIFEVVRLVPQEPVQQRIDEQIVDVPFPQIMKDIVDVFKSFSTGANLGEDL